MPDARMSLTDAQIELAAGTLWQHWQESRRLPALPDDVCPSTRADGYAIQARLAARSGQKVVGWKIAATSAAGQAHIKVDGPLAGRLLGARVLANGASVPLDGNIMRVAEAEFAFRLGQRLAPRDRAYDVEEVLASVDALFIAIEVPDSRYEDFAAVGAPQLIADDACACWFVLGPEVTADWRAVDLAQHDVAGYRNGVHAGSGRGANVLGDPRIAMTWIANELGQFGVGLEAGQIVTTGTCLAPLAVAPDDQVRMDFGVFGSVEARFAAR